MNTVIGKCEYEDCDQIVQVEFLADEPRQCMCKYHALVSLLIDFSADETRLAIGESGHGGMLK